MKLLKSIYLFLAICSISLQIQAQSEVVRFANIGHGYYAGPLYVAVRENLFQKYGLTPEITTAQGGPLVFQAVFTRQADFGIVSYEHILTAAGQGRRLVSIFNVTSRPINNIIVSNKLFDSDGKKPIKERILALKGKRIGVPSAGGSGEKILGSLAMKYGLQIPGDIELVYLGPDANTYVGAFKNNLIDAAVPFEPAGIQVEKEKLGKIYVNLMNGEVEEFRDLNYMNLITSPATIAEKPELTKKMVAIFAEAQKILLNEAKGKAIMAKEFPNLSPEVNDRAYAVVKQIWSPDGKMSIEGGKKVFDYLQPKQDKPINFPQTFTNQFLPSQ
jgi:NitT/TauT family transport system substrate-binding protein